jgi:hypothetical protein
VSILVQPTDRTHVIAFSVDGVSLRKLLVFFADICGRETKVKPA